MKNRKKQLINEKPSLVKTKLKKAFTLISANNDNTGLLKRISCGLFAFAILCLSYAFIGADKALALSKPTLDTVEYYNIFNGFTISNSYMMGKSIKDLRTNGNGSSVVETRPNGDKLKYYLSAYRNARTNNNEYINTVFDGISTGENTEDIQYYTSAGDAVMYQHFAPSTTKHIISTYFCSNVSIYNEVPDLYIRPDLVLDDLRCWYGVEPLYLTESEILDAFPNANRVTSNGDSITSKLTGKVNNGGVTEYLVPTYLELTLRIDYTDTSGSTKHFYLKSRTSDNNLVLDNTGSNTPYYERVSAHFKGALQKDINPDYSTFNTYEQVFSSVFGDFPTVNDAVCKLDYICVSATIHTYDIALLSTSEYLSWYDYGNTSAGSIYLQTSYYNEPYDAIIDTFLRAQRLITQNSYTDGALLKNFFSNFFEIEIVKGVPLYTLTTLAFGIILIIIFVRLFR